jgi:hypothetical protein
MKKLYLILFLVLSAYMSNAQKAQAYGGVEYFTSNSIRLQTVSMRSLYNTQITHDNGQMNMMLGLRYYPMKWAFLYMDTQTFMNPLSVTKYNPVQSFYTAGAGVRHDKFKLKIEHACYHPLKTDSKMNKTELYGGYTKIGVYFNM